jgi:hypothetical protein
MAALSRSIIHILTVVVVLREIRPRLVFIPAGGEPPLARMG